MLAGLTDAAGRVAMLGSPRVALYFAAGWCPMCTQFEPHLIAFRAAAEKVGKPIDLVYVSSERSAAEQTARVQALGMLQVPFEGDARALLKKQHRVWPGREVGEFGNDRRSGVPALVVLGEDGQEIAFIDAERSGAASLKKWIL